MVSSRSIKMLVPSKARISMSRELVPDLVDRCRGQPGGPARTPEDVLFSPVITRTEQCGFQVGHIPAIDNNGPVERAVQVGWLDVCVGETDCMRNDKVWELISSGVLHCVPE